MLRRLLCRSLNQRAVSAMLLAAYFITAAGVPLPAGDWLPTSGEAYPCAGGACGCRSAEQCWRSCCCHTLAERFRWARDRGVRPPEFAIAMARQAGIDLAWLNIPKPHGIAVGGKVKPKCAHCIERHKNTKPASKPTSRVVGWRALQCQGHSLNWFAAVPTLIRERADPSNVIPRVCWLGPPSSDFSAGTPTVPTPPPPERA